MSPVLYSQSSSRDTVIVQAVTPLSCHRFWNNAFKNDIELWTEISTNTMLHLDKITFIILYRPVYAAEIYSNNKGVTLSLLMTYWACSVNQKYGNHFEKPLHKPSFYNFKTPLNHKLHQSYQLNMVHVVILTYELWLMPHWQASCRPLSDQIQQ